MAGLGSHTLKAHPSENECFHSLVGREGAQAWFHMFILHLVPKSCLVGWKDLVEGTGERASYLGTEKRDMKLEGTHRSSCRKGIQEIRVVGNTEKIFQIISVNTHRRVNLKHLLCAEKTVKLASARGELFPLPP